MELRHKASGKRALKQWMAMWQLGMWSSLLIILLSNSKTSAELRKINYDPYKPLNVSKVGYSFQPVYTTVHRLVSYRQRIGRYHRPLFMKRLQIGLHYSLDVKG